MPEATTANFEEVLIEVEFTEGSDIFERVVGLTNATISETNNLEESEIPDAADDSLPYVIKRAVRSQDMKISGEAVWALESHQNMQSWFRSGATKRVRIRNAVVVDQGVAGDVEDEIIPMIFESRERQRAKGNVMTASVSFAQNGSVVEGLKV